MVGPKERGQGPDGGGIVARIGGPRGSLYPSLGEGVEEDFLGKGTSEARLKGQIGDTREGMTREAAGSSLSAGITDTPAQTPGLLHPTLQLTLLPFLPAPSETLRGPCG